MLHYHGVEIICDEALAGLNFTNFTCPPLVTTITEGMLTDCKCMFSVEIPEHVTHIRSIAFLACHSLHNVAFVVAEIILLEFTPEARQPLLKLREMVI